MSLLIALVRCLNLDDILDFRLSRGIPGAVIYSPKGWGFARSSDRLLVFTTVDPRARCFCSYRRPRVSFELGPSRACHAFHSVRFDLLCCGCVVGPPLSPKSIILSGRGSPSLLVFLLDWRVGVHLWPQPAL